MTDQIITTDQARLALKALDVETVPEHGLPFLLGALLALTEASTKVNVDRTDLDQHHQGYMSVLLAMAAGDPHNAAGWWTDTLNDRLNRTAVELYEAVDGNGRMFTDVIGPAMLAASNILVLLNTTSPDGISEDKMRNVFEVAEQNLKTARRNLGELKTYLKGQGMRF